MLTDDKNIDYNQFIFETKEYVSVEIPWITWNALHLENKNQRHERLAYEINAVKLGQRTLVLNCSNEVWSIGALLKKFLPYIRFPKNQIKLVFGTTLIDPVFKNYMCEVTHTGAADWLGFYTKLRKQGIAWKNVEINSHLIALCRRPNSLRADIIKSLLDLYGEKVKVSFHTIDASQQEIEDYQKMFYPKSIPIELDDMSSHTSVIQLSNTSSVMYKSLIHLVLETEPPDNWYGILLTEKSFKPFAYHQLPLFLAPAGQIKKLRDLGFDMFDDIFDGHPYDTETYYNLYKLKLLKVLKKFMDSYPTVDHVRSLRGSLFPRLEYNNNLLESIIIKNPPYLKHHYFSRDPL
jgi:hypothetical protein